MNKTGFGFLRLPHLDPDDEKSIDYDLLNRLVDTFIEKGGTYFDTAYTYLSGASEDALKKTVVERYPRESFRIADKLPTWEVTSYEQCQVYFEEQCKRCGVDFFDVYLMHGLDVENYEICRKHNLFQFLHELKRDGKAKKIGFSFHDSPDLLETIISDHPELDYVQLQINYLDWNSETIQARRCYEVAVKHGKRVIVMEPVKGGCLANLPAEAENLLRSGRTEKEAEILLQRDRKEEFVDFDAGTVNSCASWAIRFASSLEQVEIVLSGMNTMEQMMDNMCDLQPLSSEEHDLLEKAANIIRAKTAIPCTACGYCTANCPQNIPIPRYFSLYNEYARYPKEGWKMQYVYDELAQKFNKASKCIDCKQCEGSCPQKLGITGYLREIVGVFEAE